MALKSYPEKYRAMIFLGPGQFQVKHTDDLEEAKAFVSDGPCGIIMLNETGDYIFEKRLSK